MDEILKELDLVYKAISSIPVTYDSVDTMAVARAKLRNIYSQLSNPPQNDDVKEESANGT